MTGEGGYDDLFFNLHHDSDSWIPPEGYFFVPEVELKPLNLPGYEQIYTKEREFLVDGKFIFQDTNAGNWEDDMRFFGQLPPLERYLYHSYGEDDFVENFPFPLIDEILDNLDFKISPVMKDWIISAIKPRENRPLIFGES
jgi:hypothetical protein